MYATAKRETHSISPMLRGNIIHKLMELKLDKYFGKLESQEERNKSIMEYREIEEYVLQDETLEEHAEQAVEQVIEIYKEHSYRNSNISVITEGYVYWGDGERGRTDVYFIMEDLIHVIDLKTGENFNVIEPTDEEFRGYAAGVLRLVQDNTKIRGIRVSVINGRSEKVATFKADDIKYWDDQQIKLSEYNTSLDSRGGLTEEINNMTQRILDFIENHPEEITKEFLDAVDEMSKLNNLAKNQAIEEIKNGRKIEGRYIERKTKQAWKMDLLAEYFEENGMISKRTLLAYKPIRNSVEALMDEEGLQWAEEQDIFGRVYTNGYNLKKE